jgi:hypothetical protein
LIGISTSPTHRHNRLKMRSSLRPHHDALTAQRDDGVAEGDARAQYLVALRALDANENNVKALLHFARSLVTAVATVFRFNDSPSIPAVLIYGSISRVRYLLSSGMIMIR